MTPSKVKLKLLIDKNGKRVLFAEAGKDFVDFLFSLLSLPIATVVRLLTKTHMVGCLASLYQSIQDLSEDYMQPYKSKDILLKPQSSLPHQLSLLSLTEPSSSSSSRALPPLVAITFYECSRCTDSILSRAYRSCPDCRRQMSSIATYYVPEKDHVPVTEGDGKEGGFVKGVVTYMVMDDLTVTPMSTISSITMLNKFNVKEVSALEEKVVEIGMDQGLELLKNAFASKMVLTKVFLGDFKKSFSFVNNYP